MRWWRVRLELGNGRRATYEVQADSHKAAVRLLRRTAEGQFAAPGFESLEDFKLRTKGLAKIISVKEIREAATA